MKFLQIVAVVVTFVTVNANDPAVRPGYTYNDDDPVHGPGAWFNANENCRSDTVLTQSPIDIIKDEVKCEYFREFKFENDETAITTQAANYVQDFKIAFQPVVKISNGGLDDTYVPLLGNLYWGTTDTDGSEHSYDGAKSAAELQIYAYGETTNNLHVFVVKYKVGETDNAGLATYLNTLSDYNSISLDCYAKASIVTTLDGGFKSLLPANPRDFYRYEGTVTRPACVAANYTVFYEQAEISTAQLEALRTIQYETAGSVFANGALRHRPTQATNEREVKGTLGTNEIFLLDFVMDLKQGKKDILHNVGDFIGDIFG